MDVNGTRFHLLASRPDWARATPDATDPAADVVWDEARSGVSLRPLLYRFPRGEGLRPADRRGNGRDGFGHFYGIGADERSIETVTAAGHRSRWWPPLPAEESCAAPGAAFVNAEPAPPPQPYRLRGLTVTAHQYLVVGVPQPAQLLVFDLHAGGPPAVLPWPGPEPFRPWDMAPRADSGLWLLEADPGTPGSASRYWGLDRFFRLERRESGEPPAFAPAPFRPLPGAAERIECAPRQAVGSEGAWPLSGRPVAVEALPDGSLLFLRVERDGATDVVRYRDGARIGRADLRTPLVARFAPTAEGDAQPWVGHDLAFVPEPMRRRGETRGALYVVGQDGNQAFAFTLVADEEGLRAIPREPYFPIRLFGGRGLLADRDSVFHDLAEPDGRWLRLVAQPKPRYRSEGTVTTAALDGREPGCVWHRLVMDGCLPAGTALRVESRTADYDDRLAAAPWREEPAPYRRARGPELPFYRAFTAEQERCEGVGSWELLFQEARGRYLQLRLTLLGSGRTTPRLQAIRIHYPRFSYLREYLPDLYQDDGDSAHFLDRYLANSEGLFTEFEGRIAGVEALFDERLLDADYLNWFAGWFGTVLDPAFDDARRRLFLRHAVRLYAERGTLTGLVRALRLALDPCPSDALFEPGALDCTLGRGSCEGLVAPGSGVRVVERFLRRRVAGVVVGDPTEATAPGLVAATDRWTPDQGTVRLHQLFRSVLEQRHGAPSVAAAVWGGAFTDLRFPPLVPADPARAADWRAFLARSVAIPYAEIGAADLALYWTFLERRYRRIERLRERYGTTWTAFAEVPLPTSFPSTDPQFTDWVQFASLVVPIDRNASRFDVLVPVEARTEQAAQLERLAFVRRLVEREKPAHTEFEVKPYWALFRVGEARVGLDTLLDQGSRFVPLLLPGALGEVTAGRSHPWGVPDRFVIGRDDPAASPRTFFETVP